MDAWVEFGRCTNQRIVGVGDTGRLLRSRCTIQILDGAGNMPRQKMLGAVIEEFSP